MHVYQINLDFYIPSIEAEVMNMQVIVDGEVSEMKCWHVFTLVKMNIERGTRGTDDMKILHANSLLEKRFLRDNMLEDVTRHRQK